MILIPDDREMRLNKDGPARTTVWEIQGSLYEGFPRRIQLVRLEFSDLHVFCASVRPARRMIASDFLLLNSFWECL